MGEGGEGGESGEAEWRVWGREQTDPGKAEVSQVGPVPGEPELEARRLGQRTVTTVSLIRCKSDRLRCSVEQNA